VVCRTPIRARIFCQPGQVHSACGQRVQNGQPAFGLYGRAPDGNGYTPQAIQVLSLDRNRIAKLHGFVRPDLFSVFDLPLRLGENGDEP